MARVLSAPVGTFDSGSKMGAAIYRQMRSEAVSLGQAIIVTCGDVDWQRVCRPECSVRDEEAAGSNPATPTRKSQLRGHFRFSEVAFTPT